MRRKKQKTKLVAFIFGLLLIGIGYAALTANLKIKGTANISNAKWDVHFENAEVYAKTDTVTFDSNSNSDLAQGKPVIKGENNTELEWQVTLNQPRDGYAFGADIVNAGDIAAKIDLENSFFKIKIGNEEELTVKMDDKKINFYYPESSNALEGYIYTLNNFRIQIIPLSENITYLNPSDRKRFIFALVLDDSNLTNEEWNRIKGKDIKITTNFKYIQSDNNSNVNSNSNSNSNSNNNSNSNSNKVFSVRYDNAKFKSASATTTFPNNVNVPTIVNGMYDEEHLISSHNIEYSVIFNQPGDYYEFTMDLVNDGDYDVAPTFLENYSNKIKIGDGEEQTFKYYDELPDELEDIFEYDSNYIYEVLSGETYEILVKIKLRDDITPEQLALVQGKVIKINYQLFNKYYIPSHVHLN